MLKYTGILLVFLALTSCKSAPRTPEAPVAVAPRTDPMVEAIMVHKGAIKQCYEESWSNHDKHEGSITLTWRVDNEGHAKNIFIQNRSFAEKDVPLEDCLIDRVKSWQFPIPQPGGPNQITHTFRFQPRHPH